MHPFRTLCLATSLSATLAGAQPLPAKLETLADDETARLCLLDMGAAALAVLPKEKPGTREERTVFGTLLVLETYWTTRFLSLNAGLDMDQAQERWRGLSGPDGERLREHCQQAGFAALDQLPPGQEKAIVEQGLDRMRETLGE